MILWQAWSEGFMWSAVWSMKVFGATSAALLVFLIACLIFGLLGTVITKTIPLKKQD